MERSHAELKARLEARLAALDARIGRIARDLRRPGDRDAQEQATERENDEVLEGLETAERDEAAALRAALERIESGRYGTCERCGASIAAGRLEALPTTTLCVDCAS